ncbi:hypothetical protein [Streptomyces mirabilis]|uniref:hypothetical protein n=1 Tax=Streptomyces mirabilis TaxID=68239 RepID=UPI003652387D
MAVGLLSREDAAELFLPHQDSPQDRGVLLGPADALRVKLDNYVIDYDNDLITRKQMLDGTVRTRARLADVELRMTAGAGGSVLAPMPPGSPEMKVSWEGFDLDKKRAVINVIMTVTVHPAKRGRPKGYVPGSRVGYFDSSTVDVLPKVP